MADLLLELFSEEIPARMQAQAAKDLERLVVGALSDRGLLFEGAKAFAGPRRLTLVCAGLPVKQPDVSEERKGPRVGAPEKAVEGFLRSAGVSLEQCEKRNDGKGEFYVAVIARKGRATAEVIAEILPQLLSRFPWPKSMRWPQGDTYLTTDTGEILTTDDGLPLTANTVRWVRPLHSILCTFDGEIVPFEFAGVKSGNETRGHRFLSEGVITAKHFEDYAKKLRDAHVVLDAEERKDIILTDARNKAFALGLELIEDEGLLNEVAGLNEWPTVLIGTIEDQFMDVPAEILQTSMRTHQKYFSLRPSSFETAAARPPQDEGRPNHSPHPEEASSRSEEAVSKDGGGIANRFVVVSNMAPEDGGKAIVAGNERVLRARLSDAKFFWDQDRQHRLDSRVEKLKGITFHAKLGTQYERVERIEALAGEIAAKIGADVEKAKRAAHLCKADLTTGVVGEFPELQGIMGSYYAAHDGEDAEIVTAIREHYKPLGPGDAVPTAKVSIAVALADKLYSLIGFFAVDERPTGSGDPFALRRAALGLIRIALDAKLSLRLLPLCDKQLEALPRAPTETRFWIRRKWGEGGEVFEGKIIGLLDFIADRLKVALKEKGTRHDLIDAVFSLGNEDDLVRLVTRVEALQTFLKTDEGANLLAGYKRAANILKAEEKKDKITYEGDPDPEAFVLHEEKALYVELATASELVRAEIERERFVKAMAVMARLRAPVDDFFDKVTVNDKDANLRKNRLLLLSRLRTTLHLAADFSRIEG